MTELRLWAALLLALMLAACASVPTPSLPEGLSEQPPADWSPRRLALQELRHWQLQGKLAVRQPSDSGTAMINRWTQHGEHYQLSLSSSFLGLGHTTLNGTPGFLELTLSDGEVYRSAEPEALIRAATGWGLPMDSLTWWIKGLPDPEGDYRLLFDEQGQLAVIRQQGWDIRIERWQRFISDAPLLPARITALKDDKRVRLAVTGWRRLEAGQAP